MYTRAYNLAVAFFISASRTKRFYSRKPRKRTDFSAFVKAIITSFVGISPVCERY